MLLFFGQTDIWICFLTCFLSVYKHIKVLFSFNTVNVLQTAPLKSFGHRVSLSSLGLMLPAVKSFTTNIKHRYRILNFSVNHTPNKHNQSLLQSYSFFFKLNNISLLLFLSYKVCISNHNHNWISKPRFLSCSMQAIRYKRQCCIVNIHVKKTFLFKKSVYFSTKPQTLLNI